MIIKTREPKTGELWKLNCGDPFPPKTTAKIKDVKEGWVRYSIGRGGMFDDERMKVSTFLTCYDHYKDAETQ